MMLGLGLSLWRSGVTTSAPADPASGGDLVTDYVESLTDYRSHAFTSAGTFTVVTELTNVDILLVGGGGGGGSGISLNQVGGGGHGGEVAVIQGVTLAPGSYTVTIGAGGTTTVNFNGFAGGKSVFTDGASLTYEALGGGGGGRGTPVAASAGVHIGGGGAGTFSGTVAGGTAVPQTDVAGPPSEDYYGANGGASNAVSAASNDHSAGGGGGAGAVGQAGDASGNGGDGGAGLANTFLDGSSNYYGGGGGGASRSGGASIGSAGQGGLGGGGRGGWNGVASTAGTANTGGGGGGGGGNISVAASAGGSGIVVIRYPFDHGGDELSIAGDFFVAPETGNNLWSGLQPTTPKATIPAAATLAALGVSHIRLKGGETYAAQIPALNANTILDGNAAGDWGSGKAILGGGTRITGWETYATFGGLQCWRADLPAGYNAAFATWQDGVRLMLANNNTTNATAFTTIEQNVAIYKSASAYSDTEITASYITGYSTLVPGDNLYMQCFADNNWVAHTPLRDGSGTASTDGIDYVNGRIRFVILDDTTNGVADGRHLILNHPDDFDGTTSAAKAGTIFVDPDDVWGNGPSIYLIPFNGANPNSVDIRWTRNLRPIANVTANNVELRSLAVRYAAAYSTNATTGKITPEVNGVQALKADTVTGLRLTDVDFTACGSVAIDDCTGVTIKDCTSYGIIAHRPYHLTGCAQVRITGYEQDYCHSAFTFYNCARVIFAPTFIGPVYGRHGNTVTAYESGVGASLKPPSDFLVLGGTWGEGYTNNGFTSRHISNLVMFGSVLGHNQFISTDWITTGLRFPNGEGGYLYSNVTGPAGGQVNLTNIGANGNAAFTNLLIGRLDPDWPSQGFIDCDRAYNHWRNYSPDSDRPDQASYTTGTGLTRVGEVYQASDISSWFEQVTPRSDPDGRLTSSAPSSLATGRRYRIPKTTYDASTAPNDVILVNWIGAYPKSAVAQPDGTTLAANTMPDYSLVKDFETASGTLSDLSKAAAASFFEATVRCTGWHGLIAWVVTDSATPPSSAPDVYARTNLNGTLISAGKRPIFGFSDSGAGDEPWAWRIYGASAGHFLHATHVLFEQQTAGGLDELANGNIVTIEL